MEDHDLATRKAIERAEELEEAGQKREALEYLRVVVRCTTDAVILCRIGDLAADLDEWAEAEDAYLHAIRLAPKWAGLYEALGSLYLKPTGIGNLELARKYLQSSVEIEKTAHAYTYLGVAEDRLGMRREARKSYNAALGVDPNYEEAYYNLGVTYIEEDPSKAIALFRKALELDPNYQIAHRELGWALYGLKQYAEAETHLRRSIELNSEDGWAFIYLANLLWREKKLVSAEEAYKKAIEVWPDDSVPHRCLAHFYDCNGRIAEADFFYEKALQLDPDDPEANLRFGLFLKELGEVDKAKVYLARALDLDPENEKARSGLAEID